LLATLPINICAQTDEDCYHSNRIDRHKERDEGDQKCRKKVFHGEAVGRQVNQISQNEELDFSRSIFLFPQPC